MEIPFTKMQSLGNDFVVMDGVTRPIALSPAHIAHIVDRHVGIGCDQLLVAERPRESADFRMRIFNSDGTEVGQCGNGARCFGRFLKEQSLTRADRVRVETLTTVLTVDVGLDDEVAVDMGVPEFDPGNIPFEAETEQPVYQLDLDDQSVEISAVSMGNPHAVVVVDRIEEAPVHELGPRIENHPRFPERANVGFLERVDSGHVKLRVYERGVGETRACGSGASAAMAVGRRLGWLDASVRVALPGGAVTCRWPGEGATLTLQGSAETVYHGRIELA
jgi:diaminopimelate epimerase